MALWLKMEFIRFFAFWDFMFDYWALGFCSFDIFCHEFMPLIKLYLVKKVFFFHFS